MPCHTQNSLHGQTGSNLMSLKRSVTLPKNQLLYLRHLPRPGTQTKSIPSSSLIIVCWDSIQEKTAWNCCESFRRTNPYKTVGAHWGLSCNTPQRFTGGLPALCTSCHIPSLVHRQNPSTPCRVKLFLFCQHNSNLKSPITINPELLLKNNNTVRIFPYRKRLNNGDKTVWTVNHTLSFYPFSWCSFLHCSFASQDL